MISESAYESTFQIQLCSGAFRRIGIVAKSTYYIHHVRPSVQRYQRSFRLTDFREIWYSRLL
jgi:hypothetical protein